MQAVFRNLLSSFQRPLVCFSSIAHFSDSLSIFLLGCFSNYRISLWNFVFFVYDENISQVIFRLLLIILKDFIKITGHFNSNFSIMSIQMHFRIITCYLSAKSQFVWIRKKYFLKLKHNPFVAIKPYCFTTLKRHYWDQASCLSSIFARREVNTFTLGSS